MASLDSTLAKVVEKGILLAEKGGQFAIEQAPELVQEFYRWEVVKSLFLIIIFSLVSIFLIPKLQNTIKRLQEDEELYDMLLATFGGFALVASLFAVISNAYNLIFILTAPKLYLMEYVLGH